jgi:hypothetical protein
MAKGRDDEDAAEAGAGRRARMRRGRGLQARVAERFAHEETRQEEADHRDGDPEVEGLRPQRRLGGDVAGRPRRDAHGQVAGELVEPEGQPAPPGADEVDLHDHRHRPGQRLIGAEQDIGEVDPPPGRGPDDQERHGKAQQPASDQDRLAAHSLGQPRRHQIEHRLGHSEAHDEREDGALRGEPELLLAEQGQDRPLQPDHGSHEGIEAHEEDELGQVRAEPEPGRRQLIPRFWRRFSAKAGGWGGKSASA